MELFIEGILEAVVELILEGTVGVAESKRVHWIFRALASLLLLAMCVGLCALGIWGVIYCIREESVGGAIATALVTLFLFSMFVALFVIKGREIKSKPKEEAEVEICVTSGTELWDLYNSRGELTEKTVRRGDAIPEGFYHLVCEILLMHSDGSYLCMKRAATKPNYPGYYEATAGGSALSGEDKWQCVKRELREETGLSCNKIKELCVVYDSEKRTVYHCFFGTVDCEKDSVKLQEGETEGYKWFTEAEFIELLHSDKAIASQRDRFKSYYSEKGYI